MHRWNIRCSTTLLALAITLGGIGCGQTDTDTQTAIGTETVETYEPKAPLFDVPPRPLTQVAPEFPEGETASGKVFLELHVGVDGTVTQARVTRREGSEVFDTPALEAALQWTFEPARKDGQPVPVTVVLPIVFEKSPDQDH